MFTEINTPTVAQLMATGFTVEIIHERRYGTKLYSRKGLADRDKKTKLPGGKNIPPLKPLSPLGGRTICQFTDLPPEKMVPGYEGIAVCDDNDHYIKKEGRWRAIARACEDYCLRKQMSEADFTTLVAAMVAVPGSPLTTPA